MNKEISKTKRAHNFIDLTGKTFGKLTVLGFAEINNKRTMWLCQCECGNTSTVAAEHLKTGNTTSCGCNLKEKVGGGKITHGLSKTRLYIAWSNMKSRCYNQSNPHYVNYGGRGINICNEWYYDFVPFYEWALSNGYADNLTIDRTDVNGNYEPNNCRWITAKEQSNNTTANRHIEYKGKVFTVSQLSDKLKIPYATLLNRVNKGWSMEQIVNAPTQLRPIRKTVHEQLEEMLAKMKNNNIA